MCFGMDSPPFKTVMRLGEDALTSFPNNTMEAKLYVPRHSWKLLLISQAKTEGARAQRAPHQAQPANDRQEGGVDSTPSPRRAGSR